jgi:hypothetical protein
MVHRLALQSEINRGLRIHESTTLANRREWHQGTSGWFALSLPLVDLRNLRVHLLA